MGSALQIVDIDVKLEELVETAASSRFSIAYHPGLRGPLGTQGGTFVKRAVPWKGVTRGDGESYEDWKSRFAESAPDGVVSGVDNALSTLADAWGVSTSDLKSPAKVSLGPEFKGVEIVKGPDGIPFPVPTVAAEAIRAGDSNMSTTGRKFASFNAAIRQTPEIDVRMPAVA